MTNITLNGRIIRTSRNLRGMCAYARISRVVHVSAVRDPSCEARGVLTVTYADGAKCVASFASHGVMVDWVRSRRSWCRAVQVIPEPECYRSAPGVLA